MVLRKKKQETKQKEGKKEDVPFWLQIWNMCICSEAYKRKAIIDGIIGASFCENKQIPRYGMLLAEEKKVCSHTWTSCNYDFHACYIDCTEGGDAQESPDATAGREA